jgi:hypothetical protein
LRCRDSRRVTGDEILRSKLIKLALTMGTVITALIAGAANYKVG